jgi:hypothetical protein
MRKRPVSDDDHIVRFLHHSCFHFSYTVIVQCFCTAHSATLTFLLSCLLLYLFLLFITAPAAGDGATTRLLAPLQRILLFLP